MRYCRRIATAEGQEYAIDSETVTKSGTELQEAIPRGVDCLQRLGDRCHAAGPLDEKTRRLVKVALSMGAALEGATHSAVRNAKKAGITPDEINHVAVLAVSTLGLPAAMRAYTWASDRYRGTKS